MRDFNQLDKSINILLESFSVNLNNIQIEQVTQTDQQIKTIYSHPHHVAITKP